MKLLDFEYATFRPSIQDFLIKNFLNKPTNVLDPMAGTAPLIPFFQINGYEAYLYDILPVYYHINKVKQLSAFESFYDKGPKWFEQNLVKILSCLDNKKLTISEKWIDDSILEILVDAWHSTEENDENTMMILKGIIILSLKYFSSFTRTGNPTWIKPGGITSDRSVNSIVSEKIDLLQKYYKKSYDGLSIEVAPKCVIGISDASSLKFENRFDLIITSPPYCNRLDYSNPYSPELLFLSRIGYPTRRDKVIGTNAVKDFKNYNDNLECIKEKSSYTYSLLKRIEKKGKEGENNYYVRYYAKYFLILFNTFSNLIRCLSKVGKLYIIVQDNMHRGELIEIDRSLENLFDALKYNTKILKTWERHHLGRKNISKDYKVVHIKQFEKLMVVYK